MNLKDSRQRRMLIAFGATVAVAAGGVTAGVVAASAATTLTVTPGTTSATIFNLGAQQVASDIATQYNLAQTLANATFASRVTSTTSGNLKLVLDSAPTTTAKLFWAQGLVTASTGPAPATADLDTNSVVDTGTWKAVTTANPGTTDMTTALTGTSNTFLTADVPGTYTFHYVDDLGNVDTSDDATSPTITLTVKDVQANTVATTDDWAPTVTAPASAPIGAPVTTSITTGLTLNDARGTAVTTVPHLTTALAGIIGLRMNGAGRVEAVATAVGSTFPARSLAVAATNSAASDLVSTVYVDVDGDGTWTVGAGEAVAFGATATTDVQDNGISAIRLGVTASTGAILANSLATDNVLVKSGTAAVTFTATTTGGGAGDLVYFTLAGADAVANKLTTNGTTVDAANRIYSAVANASGVASLTVTDSDTTAAAGYTVKASSNNFYASTTGTGAGPGTALVIDYQDIAASTLVITTPSANLSPVVGTSVTITGKITDQFLADYLPTVAEDKQVTITYGAAPTTAVVTMSGGTFTHTYTPTVAATAGTTTSVSVASTLVGAAGTATITWAGAGTVADLDPIATDLEPTLAVATSVAPLGVQVSGTVKDSTGTPIPYRSVTLTSNNGVLFADNATSGPEHLLSNTLTVVANASGVYTGYATFTKAGATTIVASSGAFSDTTTVTTDAALAGSVYTVTMDDVAGAPGDTVVVSGMAKDGFANPVPGAAPALVSSNPSLGVLANAAPTTNAAGTFSTTFASGSNTSGTATLTATITPAALAPHASWALAGVTIANPTATDTATITVAAQTVALNATASRKGAGAVILSGTTLPGKTVKLYSKNKGSDDAFGFVGSVTAAANGTYSKTVLVSRSKTFVASINGDSVYSDEKSSTVGSVVKITRATPIGARKVTIALDGNPNAVGTAKIYVKVGIRWRLLATVSTNRSGMATRTVVVPSRGKKVFRVLYMAPGTTTGSATTQVTVR